MAVLRYIRMILWAFFGVRRRANAAAEEFEHGTPMGVIVTGLLAGACFVVAVLGLAIFAASKLG